MNTNWANTALISEMQKSFNDKLVEYNKKEEDDISKIVLERMDFLFFTFKDKNLNDENIQKEFSEKVNELVFYITELK